MPPKAADAAFVEGAASGPVINDQPLTLKELQVVCAILENLTTKIDANWEMVAKSLGMQNAKSAKEAWRVLRKKCNLNLDGLSDGAAAAAAAAAGAVLAASSAKKTAAPATGADGSDAAGVTPVKRGRGRPPKKAMMLTPSASVDDGGDAISTPSTAMANLSFGNMTPETPSKVGSGIKRSTEEADTILFDETPAKKKPAPRKRLSAKQRAELAANKAGMAAASVLAAATDAIDQPVNDPATPGVEPASSPIGGANGHDGDSIVVAMDGSSHVEQAIGDILASDATEAADLVGGIDPGEV